MAIDNMHKQFGKDWTCSSRDIMLTDRQTDTVTTILCCPIGVGVTTFIHQVKPDIIQCTLISIQMSFLQCFDTVGWVAGRASGL